MGIPKGAQIRFNADFGGRRWTATRFGMTSGSGLRRLCLAGARASAVRAPTIVGFLNALLWMARSGSRWRDLPRQLGRHEAVKRRYYRWIEMGVLDEI